MNSERIDLNGYFLVRDKGNGEWVMVLSGPWVEEYHQVILTRKITSLRLSYSAGWTERDISFVRNLKNIRSLEIYNWDVTDISPLAEITQLEKLGIECNYKKSIDFSQFMKLHTLLLRWRPKSENIFDATSIQNLSITNFPYENLTKMNKLDKLESLKLTSKKLLTLNGAENLSNLTSIDLFRCPSLTSLEGVQGAAKLRVIELDTCKKVNDLAPLGDLSELRSVTLNNCEAIKTLLPLRKCHQIETLFLTESTNIEDGSISVFNELPNIKTMWFANRKHYSHTREQVQEAIRLRQY